MHPVLLDIFGIKIYSYGVMLVSGFLIAVWLAAKRAKNQGIEMIRIFDLAFYVLLAGVFGAKLFLFFKEPSYYISSIKAFWSLMRSGGVILGGLIFAVIVALLYLRKHKLDSWTMLDIAGPSIILGQAIGRIGCFLAGCCWGKISNGPLAITFTNETSHNLTGVPLNVPLHPVQLYSSLADFLLFFFLIWLSKKRKFKGQIFITYVIFYSIIRFLLEFFRGDMGRITIGGPFSDAQYLCLAGFIIGSFVYYQRKRTQKK